MTEDVRRLSLSTRIQMTVTIGSRGTGGMTYPLRTPTKTYTVSSYHEHDRNLKVIPGALLAMLVLGRAVLLTLNNHPRTSQNLISCTWEFYLWQTVKWLALLVVHRIHRYAPDLKQICQGAFYMPKQIQKIWSMMKINFSNNPQLLEYMLGILNKNWKKLFRREGQQKNSGAPYEKVKFFFK